MDVAQKTLDTKLRCAGIILRYVLQDDEFLRLQVASPCEAVRFAHFVKKSQRYKLRFSIEEGATCCTLAEIALFESVLGYKFASVDVCVAISNLEEFVAALKTPEGPLMPDVIDHPMTSILARHVYALNGYEYYDFTLSGVVQLLSKLLGYCEVACLQKRLRAISLYFEALLVDEVTDYWRWNAKVKKQLWNKMVELHGDLYPHFMPSRLKALTAIRALMRQVLRWICRDELLVCVVVTSTAELYGYDVATCIAWKVVETMI